MAKTRERDWTEYRFLREEGFWWLEHPRWSLLGQGDTPFAAMMDLKQNAHDLAVACQGDDESDWSEERKRMLAFARSMVTDPADPTADSASFATLSTPREPEPEAYKVDRRVKDGWSFVSFYHTRESAKMARYDPVGNEHEIRITPLSPYTDEDGRERCHLGGCRVELVDEDERTCYYRVVGDGDE